MGAIGGCRQQVNAIQSAALSPQNIPRRIIAISTGAAYSMGIPRSNPIAFPITFTLYRYHSKG
jgi:hypothetical protein